MDKKEMKEKYGIDFIGNVIRNIYQYQKNYNIIKTAKGVLIKMLGGFSMDKKEMKEKYGIDFIGNVIRNIYQYGRIYNCI